MCEAISSTAAQQYDHNKFWVQMWTGNNATYLSRVQEQSDVQNILI